VERYHNPLDREWRDIIIHWIEWRYHNPLDREWRDIIIHWIESGEIYRV
jgi:hypothetical protein